MSRLVPFVPTKAAMAASIAALGSIRAREVGRATAFGAALVVMLGVLVPSPVGATMAQAPGTIGDPLTAEFLLVAGAGASTPQITTGDSHTCALLEDKTVRCWGSNADGRLGDGTTTNRLNPVQVLASGSTQGTDVLGGVTQIATGNTHTCALLEDKTVRCWGSNASGRLGDGTTTNRLNPVQVLASGSTQGTDVLGGVTQIATGNTHTCALLEDKTVRCWGSNASGRLGDGTTTNRLNPVQVLASGSTQGTDVLGGVTQIATGSSHTCALLEDKTVRCWGSNGSGLLGDGTTTDRLNPVQVLASGSTQGTDVLGGVTQIATGGTHTCALLEDKTVRCWGFNVDGQLGDGTTARRLNPVQVLASGTASSDPVVFLVGLVSSSSGSMTVSLVAVSCDGVLQVGLLVTCTVTGGDPGIEILWRAAYNPPFAGQGVSLDADGVGTFGFTVPAAALGEELTVELVEWLAPVSLGVVGGPVPSSVPSGGGSVPVWSFVMLALALAGGLVLRRMSAGGVRG